MSTTGASTSPSLIGHYLYKYTIDSPLNVMSGNTLSLRIPNNYSTGILPLFDASLGFSEYFIRPYDPSQMFFSSSDQKEEGSLFPLVTPVLLSSKSQKLKMHTS